MKKVLLGSTAAMLLLAGCGQGDETNKNKTVTKTEVVKEKSVSDQVMKERMQKYFDDLAVEFEKFKDAANSESLNDASVGFLETGEGISRVNKEYRDYLAEVKEPIKYEKPSKQYLDSFDIFAKFTKDAGVILGDYRDDKIDEDTFKQKYDDLNANFDKENEKYKKDLEEADAFLEKEGIDTSKMDEILDDLDNSSNEGDSSNEDEDYSLNPMDDFKEIKKAVVNKTISAGPAEFTIESIELGTIKVNDDNEYNFESTKAGEEAQIVVLNVNLKNTTDANVDYYPDQDPITTDTGEQLDPSILTNSDLVTEMKGDVQSKGKIIYELKNSKVTDLHSIDFIAGAYNDPDTMDEITPEQKITIDIK